MPFESHKNFSHSMPFFPMDLPTSETESYIQDFLNGFPIPNIPHEVALDIATFELKLTRQNGRIWDAEECLDGELDL